MQPGVLQYPGMPMLTREALAAQQQSFEQYQAMMAANAGGEYEMPPEMYGMPAMYGLPPGYMPYPYYAGGYPGGGYMFYNPYTAYDPQMYAPQYQQAVRLPVPFSHAPV